MYMVYGYLLVLVLTVHILNILQNRLIHSMMKSINPLMLSEFITALYRMSISCKFFQQNKLVSALGPYISFLFICLKSMFFQIC